MQVLKKFICNKYCFLQYFLICAVLYTVIRINEYGVYLNIIALGWSVLLLLDNLVKCPTIFKRKYLLFIYGFLLIYAISILCNYELNLFTNLKLYSVTIIQLLVIFLVDDRGGQKETLKNLTGLNNTFVMSTFIISLIGLYMYFSNTTFIYQGVVMGFTDGMLKGISVSSNTGGMLATTSIMMTIINIMLRKKIKWFDIISVLVQLCFVYLSASRSSQLCLVFFILIYFVVKIAERIEFRPKKMLVYGVAFIGTCIGIYLVYVLVSKLSVNQVLADKTDKYGFFNGRLPLWKAGLVAFQHAPFIGCSPANVVETVLLYTPPVELPAILGGGLHNIFMTILCGTGMLGLLSIFSLFIHIGISVIKYIKLQKTNVTYICVFLGVAITLLVNNMVETNILFTSNYMAYLFWLYLGYTAYFCKEK